MNEDEINIIGSNNYTQIAQILNIFLKTVSSILK